MCYFGAIALPTSVFILCAAETVIDFSFGVVIISHVTLIVARFELCAKFRERNYV